MEFARENGVNILQYGIEGNKEPFVHIPEEVVRRAVVQVMNTLNHPVLIHCNKGKHRTGVLVGCIRKVQRWSLTSIFDEYRRFAGSKVRMLDQQFIELFDVQQVWHLIARQQNALQQQQQGGAAGAAPAAAGVAGVGVVAEKQGARGAQTAATTSANNNNVGATQTPAGVVAAAAAAAADKPALFTTETLEVITWVEQQPFVSPRWLLQY